jgi:uncharacterized membrane protein SirB2
VDWFYTQMLEMHRILGWCSILLFAGRGLIYHLGGRWAVDSRGGVIAFGVNMLLVVSGLSLWGLLSFNPLRDGWLMAKLLAVTGYGACAHFAMQDEDFSLPLYFLTLLLLAYIVSLSFIRDPWLGLLG